MIEGLTFVELPVTNFQRSCSFYQSVLQFKIAHLDESNQWCLFKIPSSQAGCAIYTVERTENTQDSKKPGVRMTIRVDNFEQMIGWLEANGILIESVRIHEEERFQISGFTDPDGNVWRFWASI